MKTRAAKKIQTKLVTLLYGATFTGKTTLGLQLVYFKRNDGKPFRVAVVDAEGGGVDEAINKMGEKGAKTDNIHIFYTQSLQELKLLLEKIKNKEKLYEYDDDGNETDKVMLDADGEVFYPDAILIDGTSIFRLTSEQGLLELSKKRNTVKADKDGLVGAERFVKIQGADLEFKDYKKLNYSGQDLVLDLMAIGINVVLTAREKDEAIQKLDEDGKKISVCTGKKVHDSFKGIDYNAKTVLHMYQDEETEQIFAEVIKDRTEVHRPGEILEDPSLLDWQQVIDRNAGRENFVLKNDLNKAVEIEQKMYEKEALELHNSLSVEEPKGENTNDKSSCLDELKKQIVQKRNSLSPLKKKEMKDKLTNAGLPTAYKNVTDVNILKSVLKCFDE